LTVSTQINHSAARLCHRGRPPQTYTDTKRRDDIRGANIAATRGVADTVWTSLGPRISRMALVKSVDTAAAMGPWDARQRTAVGTRDAGWRTVTEDAPGTGDRLGMLFLVFLFD